MKLRAFPTRQSFVTWLGYAHLAYVIPAGFIFGGLALFTSHDLNLVERLIAFLIGYLGLFPFYLFFQWAMLRGRLQDGDDIALRFAQMTEAERATVYKEETL